MKSFWERKYGILAIGILQFFARIVTPNAHTNMWTNCLSLSLSRWKAKTRLSNEQWNFSKQKGWPKNQLDPETSNQLSTTIGQCPIWSCINHINQPTRNVKCPTRTCNLGHVYHITWLLNQAYFWQPKFRDKISRDQRWLNIFGVCWQGF